MPSNKKNASIKKEYISIKNVSVNISKSGSTKARLSVKYLHDK